MKLRFLLLFSPFLCHSAPAQTAAAPVIVQPGAPGKPSKTLTPQAAAANAAPIKPSAADVKFMQGMIMHHNQAVEMTALLAEQGSDPAVLEMGRRINVSQSDEMAFMKRWLTDRGYPLTDPADDMGGMDMSQMDMPMMPGMLTRQQMAALKAAHGPAFDHLFLTGMIQHHTGALTMVQELFANPGAGQDPVLFDFATDVDNTQTAEINIMKALLKKEKQ
jgi:uncharacterized protein (DUF305 family)